MVEDNGNATALLRQTFFNKSVAAKRLGRQEVTEEEADRVFTPVGLDLGADGPEQIAVSIVAELLAARSGRQPHHLRERQSGIHGG